MSISFGSSFTQISYTWQDWKNVQLFKNGNHQYHSDGTLYTIYFYDGPEVHACTIWLGVVPDSIINSGYTQEMNDSNKLDFENNFLATANQTIDKINQQRNSIHEVNVSNFAAPAHSSNNFYIAISLSNLNGTYQHPTATKIKLYGCDGIAAKTINTDLWILELGVITELNDVSATVSFINTGAIYLSNNGISNSTLLNMDFPIFIDLSVNDGYFTNIVGALRLTDMPEINLNTNLIDASGMMVFPQIGDIIVTVSCVSDVTGFTPAIPTGSCIFQYHLWYTVE